MTYYKYVSVEITLLLCAFAMTLQMAVMSNLMIYRTCYTLLNFNESDCAQLGSKTNNITTDLEPKIQPTVNHINMVNTIMHSLFPLVMVMYVGTWSDKFGRKPFIALCLFGLFLSTSLSNLVVHFTYLSPWWFIISTIPSSLTGGFTALFIVISAYITDITTQNDRVVRLALFEVIYAGSSFVANLLTLYLFHALGYQIIFLISAGLTGLSFLYTIFFLPESLTTKKKVCKIGELLETINMVSIVKDTIRKRHTRTYIFAIVGVQIITGLSSGQMSIGTLFLRAKLHWTLSKINVTSAVMDVTLLLGTVSGTYLLYKKLKIKELSLCIFGMALMCVKSILFGIATNDYYIYTGYAFSIFAGIPSLMLKTMLSFLVTREEIGKIFAVSSIIMTLVQMLSSLIFPLIYDATLDTYPGIYNFVVLGILIVAEIILVAMSRLDFPYITPSTTSEENSNLEKK